MSEEDEGPRPIDDRFEILEVWRRPLRGDVGAAVRVLAKVEAGAYGPEEYAVGVSTRPDARTVLATIRLCPRCPHRWIPPRACASISPTAHA